MADWTVRLPDLTAGYALEDIYNADETELYYRALPERSMVIRGDPRKGIKTSKERVTMLLACSTAGDKLKPLVIGKWLKPRCFRGVDKANKKAWMTSSLFKEWLERLNSKMLLQGRHILLFVDNCGAHPDIQLINIRMLFLPPNRTSHLQPCGHHRSIQGPLSKAVDAPRLGRDGRRSHGHRVNQVCQFARCDPLAAFRLG